MPLKFNPTLKKSALTPETVVTINCTGARDVVGVMEGVMDGVMVMVGVIVGVMVGVIVIVGVGVATGSLATVKLSKLATLPST